MQTYNVNTTSSKEDDNGGLGLCQQSMLINLENDFPSCADLTVCNLAPDKYHSRPFISSETFHLKLTKTLCLIFIHERTEAQRG